MWREDGCGGRVVDVEEGWMWREVTPVLLVLHSLPTHAILYTWATLSTSPTDISFSTGVTLIIAVTTLVTCTNHACHTPLVILAIHIHDTFSTFYTFYIFYTFYTFYFKAGPLMPELLSHLFSLRSYSMISLLKGPDDFKESTTID